MFEKKRRTEESYEYVPEWEVEGYESEQEESEPMFSADKRLTKEEILRELEAEQGPSEEPSTSSGSLFTPQEPTPQEEIHSPDDFTPRSRFEKADTFDFNELKEDGVPSQKAGKKSKKRKNQKVHQPDIPEYDFSQWEESSPSWVKILLVVIIIIASIIGLGFLGYVNTDIDGKGNTYIIPLEIRYERQYVLVSDQLLNLMLTMDKTLEDDLQNLPNNSVEVSAKLNQDLKQLQSATNRVSRYVGVPTKFDTYNDLLINFSLNLQTFLNNALSNYNDSGYADFVAKGIADYKASFEEVKQTRLDVDEEVFRNVTGRNAGTVSEKSSQEETNNAE